jgi:hypothetical protein
MILSKKTETVLYNMTDKIRNNGFATVGEYKGYTLWRISDDRVTLFYTRKGFLDWTYITCFDEDQILQYLPHTKDTFIGITKPEYIEKLRKIENDF